MNELALFAGAGGGILGGKLLGWRTVCAVEVNPYCREVLLRRQEEGHIEPFPIWDDVRTFDGKPWRGKVDVVSAGFPCQPFSIAGQRKGEDDERNMWPDTLRILCEVRPRFALLENVSGLLAHEYAGEIFRGLAESGFDARWRLLSAAEVGAPHRRDRLWIVANAENAGLKTRKCVRMGISEQSRRASYCREQGEVADANGERRHDTFNRLSKIPITRCSNKGQAPGIGGWWATEPDVGRVADGVAYRVDRLKALGNGQVPRVAAEAWEALNAGR